eukprot:UN09276
MTVFLLCTMILIIITDRCQCFPFQNNKVYVTNNQCIVIPFGAICFSVFLFIILVILFEGLSKYSVPLILYKEFEDIFHAHLKYNSFFFCFFVFVLLDSSQNIIQKIVRIQ